MAVLGASLDKAIPDLIDKIRKYIVEKREAVQLFHHVDYRDEGRGVELCLKKPLPDEMKNSIEEIWKRLEKVAFYEG
jgi:hypothetical protein